MFCSKLTKKLIRRTKYFEFQALTFLHILIRHPLVEDIALRSLSLHLRSKALFLLRLSLLSEHKVTLF